MWGKPAVDETKARTDQARWDEPVRAVSASSARPNRFGPASRREPAPSGTGVDDDQHIPEADDRLQRTARAARAPDARMARLPVSIVAEVDPETIQGDAAHWHGPVRSTAQVRAWAPGTISSRQPAPETATSAPRELTAEELSQEEPEAPAPAPVVETIKTDPQARRTQALPVDEKPADRIEHAAPPPPLQAPTKNLAPIDPVAQPHAHSLVVPEPKAASPAKLTPEPAPAQAQAEEPAAAPAQPREPAVVRVQQEQSTASPPVKPRRRRITPDPFAGIDPDAPSVDTLAAMQQAAQAQSAEPPAPVAPAAERPAATPRQAKQPAVSRQPRAVASRPSTEEVEGWLKEANEAFEQAAAERAVTDVNAQGTPPPPPIAARRAPALSEPPPALERPEVGAAAREPDPFAELTAGELETKPEPPAPAVPVAREPTSAIQADRDAAIGMDLGSEASLPRASASVETEDGRRPRPPTPSQPTPESNAPPTADKAEDNSELSGWIDEVSTPATTTREDAPPKDVKPSAVAEPRPDAAEQDTAGEPSSELSSWMRESSRPADSPPNEQESAPPVQSSPLADAPTSKEEADDTAHPPDDPFAGLTPRERAPASEPGDATPEQALARHSRPAEAHTKPSPSRNPARGSAYPLSVRRLNVADEAPIKQPAPGRPRMPLVRPWRDDLSINLPPPTFPHSYSRTTPENPTESATTAAETVDAVPAEHRTEKPEAKRSRPNLLPRFGLLRQWREARAAKAREKQMSFREKVAELEAMLDQGDVAQRR
jgi:hypothetical protein